MDGRPFHRIAFLPSFLPGTRYTPSKHNRSTRSRYSSCRVVGCFTQCFVRTFLRVPSVLNCKKFDFLTLNLITHFIQKICVNIVKFKSFLKNFY
jgi:hypothetical protein